jgi:type II secretory pathway pseudopilin PulG
MTTMTRTAEMLASSIRSKSEHGGTLLALLVVMTLGAILLLAVAPTVSHSVQRQKELESIRRGEEVAEAIKRYVEFYQGARLPTSMDELLEGLPSGTQKVQILRKSAATDPLTEDGRWVLVKPDSGILREFASQLQEYNNGALPPSGSVALDRFALPVASAAGIRRGLESDEGESSLDMQFEGTPFIGVVSQSKADSIIMFYGIEKHSKWVFTPLFRGQQDASQFGRPGRFPGPPLPNGPRQPRNPGVPDAEER